MHTQMYVRVTLTPEIIPTEGPGLAVRSWYDLDCRSRGMTRTDDFKGWNSIS